MKTIKIYLSAFAFILAIGGVYASKMVVPALGYYYINNGEITPTNPPFPSYKECFALEVCENAGAIICRTTVAHTVNVNGMSTNIPIGTQLYKTDGVVCIFILLRRSN